MRGGERPSWNGKVNYLRRKRPARKIKKAFSKQLSSPRGGLAAMKRAGSAPQRGQSSCAVAIAPVPSVCRQKNESPAGKFVFAEPPRLRRRVQAPHFTGFCAAWRLRARGPRLRRLPQALPVRAPALLRPKGRSLRIEARMKIRRGRLPKRRRRLREVGGFIGYQFAHDRLLCFKEGGKFLGHPVGKFKLYRQSARIFAL